MVSPRKLLTLGACIGSLALPCAARAGNDDGILLGNDAALTAGAVTATASDGSALWYNPAGLANAPLDAVDVSASAFVLRSYRMPKLLSAADGSRGDASVTEIVSVPSALTFVRTLGAHTVAGVGLFVPQSNDFTLRSSLVTEGFLVTRWQVALSQEEVQYHGGAGLAWAPSPRFSIGFGLFGIYYTASGSTQVAGGVESTGGTQFGFGTQSLLQEDSLIGAAATAGVMWRPIDALRVGLSVRSPALSLYRSGRLTSVDASSSVADPDAPEAAYALADDEVSEAQVNLFEPTRVRLGVAWLFGASSLSIEGDVQHALTNDDLELERELVWNVRAGGRFAVSDRVALGAGFFTDRGADPETANGAGPVHFYGGTLGGQYSNVRKLDASEAKDSLTFSTTLALRYAHGSGKLEGVFIDTANDYEVLTPAVDVDVDEISLHIGSALYF